jgi:integrase
VKKLTERFLAKTKKSEWDVLQTGLGIKVTPTGAKIWMLQVRLPGQNYQSKLTLGNYPGTSLAAARTKAEEWRGLIKRGIDPRDLEAAARKAEIAKRGNIFGPFAEKFISAKTNRRRETDAQEIRRQLLPEWSARSINEIGPADVRELFAKLIKKPYEAKHAWTHASSIFKQATHEQIISVSPMASLNKRLIFKNAKIEPRQRVLNDTELFAFWRASVKLNYPSGPFFRLLLLTGCRLNELAKARWSELHPELRRLLRDRKPIEWEAVDPGIKILVIPRERFKSDAEHIVQLSDDACRILASLPKMGGDFLFTLNGEKPAALGEKTKLDAMMLVTLKAMARKRDDDPATVTLPRFVNHDLRRVVRTNLAALGVEDHIAEMCLGHGRKGLQRIYDQHKYEPQIREALEAWAAKVRTIIGVPTAHPTNVVPLTRAKKK